MNLKNFASADLEPLIDLWVHSWQQVYSDIDFQVRRAWFQAHVTSWLETGGLCRVMWLDGDVAGFLMLRPQTGHIDQICVNAASKGAGIAQALMEDARDLSRSGLHLDVNTTNARAISFYRRQGFVETGRGHNPSSGLAITFMAWAKPLHLDEIMVDL